MGRSSGCTDAFSVFGFLAFVLALLNLLMTGNDGGDGSRRRKRRETTADHFSRHFKEDLPANVFPGKSRPDPEMLRSGLLSGHQLLQGFLRALDCPDQSCSRRTLCQAATQTADLGLVGQAFVRASRWVGGLGMVYVDNI